MKRLSNASGPAGLILGMIALVLVMCGGTAVAATLITTNQIKNSAITTPKIANGAVTGAKVKKGSLSLADITASDRKKLLTTPINTTIVSTPDETIAAGDISSVTATCPAGKKITGGGYFSSIAIAASSQPSGRSWVVIINNSNNSIDITANAYAVCA
ncbi:MAG: hypothetical protein FWD95_15835 [Nocardioidaceae bacterium]|nr:hypothetical protein [Nocardioidaceae bacterium]